VAKKSTKDEIQNRVNVVYELILRAHSHHQIVQHGSELWGVSERQVRDYMAEARKLIALDSELERPQWLQAALARLQDYEREARAKGNLSIAIKALEDQAKLLRFEISSYEPIAPWHAATPATTEAGFPALALQRVVDGCVLRQVTSVQPRPQN
jgi:hypothetical protein